MPVGGRPVLAGQLFTRIYLEELGPPLASWTPRYVEVRLADAVEGLEGHRQLRSYSLQRGRYSGWSSCSEGSSTTSPSMSWWLGSPSGFTRMPLSNSPSWLPACTSIEVLALPKN